jgi:hypothetical protein
VIVLKDDKGELVAVFASREIATRAIACVNACKGMTDDDLRDVNIRDEVTKLRAEIAEFRRLGSLVVDDLCAGARLSNEDFQSFCTLAESKND